jgi:hypothetical protein
MNHRLWHAGAAVLVAGSLLAACSGGSSGSGPDGQGLGGAVTATTKANIDTAGNWTVMVYMAADNNLEGAALADLAEMGSATGTEFVVLLDRAPGYSSADILGLGDFTDTVLLDVKDGQATLLDTPGELDMGDPAVLENFVSYGLENHPNDKTGLVIWDHGGSWKGAAWDETSNDDNLTVADISTAVSGGLTAAGAKKLDMIGFDACLMATYEVASAVAPMADYLVASEEVEPGNGWDWSTLSTPIGGITTEDMGSQILQGFTDESQTNNENSTTLSLVDLNQLPALDTALSDLALSMTDQARDQIGRVGYARNQAIGFGKDPQPENDYFSVDMGDLATSLVSLSGMEDSSQAVLDALDTVVVDHLDGPVAAKATGLAAYFPPSSDLHKAEYDQVGFSPSWSQVLGAYYRNANSVTGADLPTFVDTDRYIEAEQTDTGADGIFLKTDVQPGTGGNIIQAYLFWGEVDANDSNIVTWFGELNADVNGDTVSGGYDWRYLTISDGTTETPAYAQLNFDAAGVADKIIVPVLFQRGGEEVSGNLQLSLAGDSIVAETFYLRTGAGISAVTPEAGDTFVPLLERENLTDGSITWIPGTDGVLDARTAMLQYTYGQLPAATPIIVGLGIDDIVGNEDLVFTGTATPAELG